MTNDKDRKFMKRIEKRLDNARDHRERISEEVGEIKNLLNSNAKTVGWGEELRRTMEKVQSNRKWLSWLTGSFVAFLTAAVAAYMGGI